MDAIKFIVQDIERAEKSPWLKTLFLAGVFLLPIALGLGLRAQIDDSFDARLLLPNLMAAILLVTVPALFLFKRRLSSAVLFSISAAVVLCLAFASERVFFPVGAAEILPTQDAFFEATSACFSKGCIAAFVMAIWIAGFSFTVTSWPSRSWRFLLSMVSALSASVMLGFHCDSAYAPHVLLGHVLPGVVLGIVGFISLEVIFKIKMKKLAQAS